MSMARILSSIIKSGRSSTTVSSSRRLFCTSTSLPKDSYSSWSSSAEHVTSATPPPPPPPPRSSRSPWIKLLKFSIIGAFTSAVATAGYTTYAYSLDEVVRKTKSFRDSANVVILDSSTIDKIQASVRSKAMKACVDTIELYLNIRRVIEEHVRNISEPSSDKLLPDMQPIEEANRVGTLVLDLNDTLIHTDWKRERGWRTYKRPGVDAFLENLCQYFEIVLYTDQFQNTMEEVVDGLDPHRMYIKYHLSRSDTKYDNGKHYRDLSKLNRDPSRVIYVSAHALESCLQPENSVQIKPWTADDINDTALLDLIPFLQYIAEHRHVVDTRKVIASYEGSTDIGKEYIERIKEAHRRMLERQQKRQGWLFQR